MTAHVTVTGTGRVERPADIALATFVVEGIRPTAAEARSVAAEAAASVIAALGAAGVAQGDLTTAGIDVSPTWEHEGNRPVRTGFTVTNRIGAVIRDLELVGRVLDAGLESGATGLDGVSFQLADTGPASVEARTLAVADAYARASTIAQAAGATLGALVSVTEGGAPAPFPKGDMRMAMAAPAFAPTPVMPGSVEVVVSVGAAWELVTGREAG